MTVVQLFPKAEEVVVLLLLFGRKFIFIPLTTNRFVLSSIGAQEPYAASAHCRTRCPGNGQMQTPQGLALRLDSARWA
eukprot:5132320-Lingulodinium_polyedra.AAC.1